MSIAVNAQIDYIVYHWISDEGASEGSDHFGVNVQVLIGTENADVGSDSFDALVCSPSWLAAQAAKGGWDLLAGAALTGRSDYVTPGAGNWFMKRWSQESFGSSRRRRTRSSGRRRARS